MLEEWKLINVADGTTMRTVEIGDTARCVDVALIVVGRVEGGISGGSSVDIFGERVSGLKIVASPAARECGLQCVVDRVRVAREKLIYAVASERGRGCTRDRVGKCIVDNRSAIAGDIRHNERVSRTGVH